MYKNIHLEQHQVDHYLSDHMQPVTHYNTSLWRMQQLMANAFLECVSKDPVSPWSLETWFGRTSPPTNGVVVWKLLQAFRLYLQNDLLGQYLIFGKWMTVVSFFQKEVEKIYLIGTMISPRCARIMVFRLPVCSPWLELEQEQQNHHHHFSTRPRGCNPILTWTG
jgi:hypothetical protein